MSVDSGVSTRARQKESIVTYRRLSIPLVAICLGLLTACGAGSGQTAPATESNATVATTAAPTTVPVTVAATPAPTAAPTLPPTTAAPAAASSQPLMPAVVCMNLQDAQDLIQTVGVFYSQSVDATGRGRSQIIDSNWQVVAQTPDVGSPFGEGDAVLAVVKIGEQPNPC
jgi:hypothetical protein